MSKHIIRIPILVLALSLLVPGDILAITYYENNFESGAQPKSFPETEPGSLWTLQRRFPSVYGDRNFFKLSKSSPHSGNYSLEFNYSGLNGFCNVCGHKSDKHIAAGHNGVNYFISKKGHNLSIADNPRSKKQDDGIKAEPGKIVYNLSNGYSRWEVLSVTNQYVKKDRLNLKLIQPGIHGEKTINSNDKIAVTRHCGVDGIVGISKGKNQINRRSDCNGVITWFANVEKQKPGSSIYRRQYLKANVSSPSVRQKLHYLRPDRKGKFKGEIVLFGQATNGKMEPELSGLSKYGPAKRIYKTKFSKEFVGLEFKKNVWYYIEEQYKAATIKSLDSQGNVTEYNNDGEYRLWFAESGREPGNKARPTLEVTGLKLAPIRGGNGTHISFWGNTQHKTDNYGKWYIDDVKITDHWNGPAVSR